MHPAVVELKVANLYSYIMEKSLTSTMNMNLNDDINNNNAVKRREIVAPSRHIFNVLDGALVHVTLYIAKP